VEEGDRIAQLIIERIQTPEVLEVSVSIMHIYVLGAPLNACIRTWIKLFVEPEVLDRQEATPCSLNPLRLRPLYLPEINVFLEPKKVEFRDHLTVDFLQSCYMYHMK
jgi:hypothetical protein